MYKHPLHLLLRLPIHPLQPHLPTPFQTIMYTKLQTHCLQLHPHLLINLLFTYTNPHLHLPTSPASLFSTYPHLLQARPSQGRRRGALHLFTRECLEAVLSPRGSGGRLLIKPSINHCKLPVKSPLTYLSAC